MRGATGGPPQGRGKTRHFNPRTPRGVRLDKRHLEPPPELEFQSTRPMRGATSEVGELPIRKEYFNPRAPCGARLSDRGRSPGSSNFNPRAPCGARPVVTLSMSCPSRISIHAPHAGRDVKKIVEPLHQIHFNPRAPCGARLGFMPCQYRNQYFNPRAPCGARLSVLDALLRKRIFQSTRPMRGATHISHGVAPLPTYFNPRAPCGARRG